MTPCHAEETMNLFLKAPTLFTDIVHYVDISAPIEKAGADPEYGGGEHEPADEEEHGGGQVEGTGLHQEGLPLRGLKRRPSDAPPPGNQDDTGQEAGLVEELAIEERNAQPERAVPPGHAGAPKEHGEEHHAHLGQWHAAEDPAESRRCHQSPARAPA